MSQDPNRRIHVTVQPQVEQIIHSDFIPTVSGSGNAATAISANQAVLADSASLAVSASVADTVVSASYALTASFVPGSDTAVSASHALQADNAKSSDTSILADSASFVAGSDVFGTVDNAATASLAQTASFADFAPTATSASHALVADLALGGTETASYVAGGNVDGAVELANTGSYVGGVNVDGAVASATSASHALQADNAATTDAAISASYVQGSDVDGQVASAVAATSASHALQADNAQTADSATAASTAVSASHALQADAVEEPVGTAVSASHALRADDADSADLVDYANVQNKPSLVSQSMDVTLGALTGSDAWFSGDINVQGTGSFSVFKTQYVTSSIIEASGSTKFGDDAGDLHQRTGSMEVTGPVTASGFSGDGSQITGVVSASHALNADAVNEPVGTAVSASHATQADNAITADSATSASYVQGSAVDGAVATATSASHALQADNAATADLATSANSASYVQGSAVDGAVSELTGSVRLEANSNMSAGQFVHNRIDLGILSSDFTMSFDNGNVQRFQAGANLSFDISNLLDGGFYSVEIENTGSFVINLPTGMLWHDGTRYPSASVGLDALDVYGIHKSGARTYAWVTVRSASLGV